MLTACSDSSGTAGDAAAASDTSETEVENEGVLTLDSEDDIDPFIRWIIRITFPI